MDFARLGAERFEIYEEYGLDTMASLPAQLTALGSAVREEIAPALLKIALQTLSLVGRGETDSALWCADHNLSALVGQTLFWAKHYFVPDLLTARLLGEQIDPLTLVNPIRSHLRIRSLIESGLVAPLLTELAAAEVAQRVISATSDDLADRQIVDWVKSQMILEGPTAREVLLVSALDDTLHPNPFMYNRLQPDLGADGAFTTRGLSPFDPNEDYGPWIETVKNQFTAKTIQRVNVDLAVAELVGGRWLAPSPFRARLVKMLGVPSVGPDFLADVDVPWLPDVDLKTLASLASNDAAVANLRSGVAHCVSQIDAGTGDITSLQDLVDEHASEAANALSRSLKTDLTLKKLVPASAVGGSLVLSATLGPLGFAVGALAAIGTGAPLLADHLRERRSAPFLFWSARKRAL